MEARLIRGDGVTGGKEAITLVQSLPASHRTLKVIITERENSDVRTEHSVSLVVLDFVDFCPEIFVCTHYM